MVIVLITGEHAIIIKKNKLFVYDSVVGLNLSKEELTFLSKRYPNVKPCAITKIVITIQPDGTTCGVYASATAVSILLGKDMMKENFSRNAQVMREHYIKILNSRQVERFPQQK